MIVEVSIFRLKPGADVDAFLAADAQAQQGFYYQQHGFVRRTTARDGDEWLVETLWYDMACAEDADARASSDHLVTALAGFVDGGRPSARRFEDIGG